MKEKHFTASTNVARIAYYEESETLEVEFTTGSIYHYADFPEDLWESAVNASSIGSFINSEVKGKYPYTRIR